MSAFTRRHLQVALGILWLLDGGLQLQPFMFSHSFLTHVIEPTAAGQPRFVAVSILRAAHLMSRHLAFDNSGAAAIQVLIGVGMLVPRTVKPALLVSFAWALGVWALGEGFGVLLTGEANALTGAPGAVLLYVLAGLLVWPVNRPAHRSAASQGLLNDHGGRLVWANLWLGFAALSLLPANIAANGASAAFEAGGSVAPGPLAYLDAALGRASAGHGTPITIGLAVVEAGLGAGIMHEMAQHRRRDRGRVRVRGLGHRARPGRPGHRAGHRPEFRPAAHRALRCCLHASCLAIAPHREERDHK